MDEQMMQTTGAADTAAEDSFENGYDPDIGAVFDGTAEESDASGAEEQTAADTDANTTAQTDADAGQDADASDAGDDPASDASGAEEQTAADTDADTTAQADADAGQDAGASEAGDDSAGDASGAPPVYLDVAFGDASGRIAQDDAARIGAAVGLTPQQLVQAIADGSRMQQAATVLDTLHDYADVAGQSFEDFCQGLADQLPEMETGRIMQDLQQKYPTSDPALLESLARQQAETRLQRVQADRQAAAQQRQQQADSDKFDAAVARWSEVGRLFPEIKSRDDVPKSVYDACNNGGDPVTEMYRYRYEQAAAENKTLQRQLHVAQQNANNRQRSAGSMSGTPEGKTFDEEIAEIFAR